MSYLVNAIGHVQLNVVDIEACVRDATEILGLRVTHRSVAQVWLSSNGRAAELVLHRADRNAVKLVAFEAMTADDVAEVASRISDVGGIVCSTAPSLPCAEAGVTFSTAEGLMFEIHTPLPDTLVDRRYVTSGVGPNRMDHVNITSPDPVRTREQLEHAFGLRLSERMVDDSLSWMRGGNRQHHILGIVRGDAGLHHYSFELSSFDDYRRLGDVLDIAGKELIWGPGRHRPGDNLFAYYLDASGCMVELSNGMSLVGDDRIFVPHVITQLTRPDNVRAMNVWGPPAPLPWREHRFGFAKAPSA